MNPPPSIPSVFSVDPSVPRMKDHILTEALGSGTYATVYKAVHKGQQKQVVAVKCIRRSCLTSSSMANLLTEIKVMKQLQHEHIVKLEEFEWDSNYIFLIMEYCNGGDLSNFIKSKKKLAEAEVKYFLQQLDFGMAQHLTINEVAESFRGSPLYMAPEIMQGHSYDAKVDLWSVGVILFESLFGAPPFASKTLQELEIKLLDTKPVEIPERPIISVECADLLQGLLERDPQSRISFDRFFGHSFIDLDHMPSTNSLSKARSLIKEAVVKDSEGKLGLAVALYSEALEHFLPALKCMLCCMYLFHNFSGS
jgi:serine/threonine-protein kinase ULK/ATG1